MLSRGRLCGVSGASVVNDIHTDVGDVGILSVT